MAEGLHHQVGGEAQAGQLFQFVTGHRAGGVLGTDSAHARLAVGAGANAVHAAGLADHLLRQGEALAGIGRIDRGAEHIRVTQAQRLARLGGQRAADDQRDTAAGLGLVEQHVGLQREFGDHLARFVLDLALVGLDHDHVAGVHLLNRTLDRQCAGVFHGVEEDRCDLAAQHHAAVALVRHEGDVVAHVPQHRVGGGFARGAGADHVADIGQRQTLGLQFFDVLDRADLAGVVRLDAVARVLQHRQGVQRDVRTRPGILCRRQVIGVGLAGHLEHGQLDLGRHISLFGKPLRIGPGLDHRLGVGVAGLGLFFHIVEGVEHQQGAFQLLAGQLAQLGVIEQLDHRLDVVTTQHGAQQFQGLALVQQR